MLHRIIIINLLIDILAFWFDPGGVTAIARIVIIYGWFFLLLIKKKIKLFNHASIFVFIFYVLLLLFLSDSSFLPYRNSLKVFTSFLMFIIGYSSIKNEYTFYKYIKQFVYVYIIILLNTLFSNIFGLGTDDYTKEKDYVVGGLNDMWNLYTYSLLILPLLLIYIKNRKLQYFIKALALIIFILLLVSLKRIAILGVLLGFLLYYLKVGIKIKYIKSLSVIGFLFLLTLPIYIDLFESRLNARVQRNNILEVDGYKNESRYLEFFLLFDNMSQSENLQKTVFGREPFDSRGAFGNVLGQERQLHVDYNNIIYTIGLIGMFLYFCIYLRIYIKLKEFRRRILRMNSSKYKPHLALAYSLLVTSLVTSFAGQMDQITFRTIIFMTIGCIFGLIKHEIKNFYK